MPFWGPISKGGNDASALPAAPRSARCLTSCNHARVSRHRRRLAREGAWSVRLREFRRGAVSRGRSRRTTVTGIRIGLLRCRSNLRGAVLLEVRTVPLASNPTDPLAGPGLGERVTQKQVIAAAPHVDQV